ncbi:MAG TPA: ATP-binding protein [Bryobacteraceae bacterium]|jgi:DNA replication protein DnaC
MTETVCPICDGTGWKIVERAGLSGAEACVCSAVTRGRAIKESSGIPPNYEHVTLDNFQMPSDNPTARNGLGTVLMQVRSFVREFPAGDHAGLLLVGDTGTGKTHLAVAALKALIDKGHQGVFFDYQNLLDRIRSSYDSTSGASDREAYRAALDTEVLLLDDLGSHRVTEWVEDTVTSIITYRCNHQRPLIATTNLLDEPGGRAEDYKRKTLPEVIGLRAWSRLHEMCRVVRMPAVEDYRMKRR